MKTDDLISALSVDLPATGPRRLRRGLAVMTASAIVLAVVGLMLSLGLRPDLATAMTGTTFWMKAFYTALVAVVAFWLLDRAGRPGASALGPILALAVVVGLALIWGMGQMGMAEPVERMPMLMGRSARVCPINILGLAILAAPFLVWAARALAPMRPTLAGAAVGLLAGALAATVYGLHCPERTAAFVAIWYTLGMALPALAGAIAGRLFWRW